MILAVLLAVQTVGVLEFRDRVPPSERLDAQYLSDRVRAAVKDELPDARVITRENMLVILEASGKKLEDCDADCEVDTARRIGADRVISGEILQYGKLYKLNMKLHDAASGELLAADVASGADAERLEADIPPTVHRLLSRNAPAARAPERRPPSGERASHWRLAAHALLGLGSAPQNIAISATSDEYRTEIVSAFALNLGVDAGLRFSESFSAGIFGAAAPVFGVSTLFGGGLALRLDLGNAGLDAGLGFGRSAAGISGPVLRLGAELRLAEHVALRGEALWVAQSSVDSLYDAGPASSFFGGGVTFIY